MSIDFRRKQRIRKILYSRVTIGILLLLALVIGKAAWGVYKNERDTENRLREVRSEYQELSKREEFLKKEIERLGTAEGVEEELREQFGVAKEGEKAIIIVEPDDDDRGIRDAQAGGFWGWIKNLFR